MSVTSRSDTPWFDAEPREALRQSQELYQRLVEACPDSVVMSDLQGIVLFASRQTWQLLGLPPSEPLIGLRIADYVIEEDRPRLAANLTELIEAGERRSTQYTTLRPDGTRVPTETSSTLIRDAQGHPVSIIAIIRDATKRQAEEEALRQSRDELRAIYEGMFDGVFIVDIQSRQLVRANAAICRMLGYSKEELPRLTVSSLHPPEFVPTLLERLQGWSEGRHQGHFQSPMMRKDGSQFVADVVTNPIRYGQRPCIAAFVHDITQEKEAQEALERERRTLGHLLQASDHDRQMVAYDIHDGLAQQLAGAIMQFQIYDHLKDTDRDGAGKAHEAGVALLRQGHSETRRLISGLRPPILDEAGVLAAVSHLVNDQQLRTVANLEIQTKVTFDRLATVLENAIYRIVQEGLTNACKHSRSPRIRIRLTQRGDWLDIEVRDWGVGFAPKEAQRNRFGLEGVRERARLLGGTCTIRSKSGKGTSVLVKVPLVEW